MLLQGAELNPAVEVHNPHRRSDLKFQHAKEEKLAAKALQRALQQLQARRYGHPGCDRQPICCALVFTEDRKEFVQFAVVPS